MVREARVATIALLACAILDAADGSAQLPAQPGLTIEITCKTSATGTVRLALWKGAAKFLTPPPYRTSTVQLADGRAEVTFADLDVGEYAVSAFLDKNGNGQLDRSLIGKPAEPHGFSNGARGKLGPPKFRDAVFQVSGPNNTISVHLE
jgi:uncharacterized protein (DUF2141 family)